MWRLSHVILIVQSSRVFLFRVHYRYILFLSIVLGICACVYADIPNSSAPILIKYNATYEQYVQRIKEVFPATELLEQFTFHADMHMQQEEFYYLVDLKEGSYIKADDVIRAVTYLFKKNIFEQITISCTQGVAGICMHFELKSFLTLGRVKIRGMFTDKQKYMRCYVIDRGDHFDNESHERSLEKMKYVCRGEGYFSASLKSTFAYDDRIKVVHPTISLVKGPRFAVNKAEIVVRDDGYVMGDQKEILQKKIYRTFLKRLIHKPYDKEQLNQCAHEIKEYLARQGYVAATITLDERIDTVTRGVGLCWHVDIHHKCSLVFWGNRFFSDNQLHQYITEFGQSAWLLPASLLAQEIERVYREKGFWNLSIEVQEEKERYFFMIKEGARASIERVELVQVNKMDPQVIIKNCFAGFLKTSYFDQELLESSCASVLALYEKNGFLDARIIKHEVIGQEHIPELRENTYVVRVIVDEGDVKRCVGVEIPGFAELCQKGPFGDIVKVGGGVLYPQMLQEQRLFLQKYFIDKGYRLLRLEPELREQSNNEVVIVWHIESDKTPICFGKTVVQGCCTYPFDRLMRELYYKPGQIWHQDALKKTFLHFKKRAIFDAIYMHSDHKNVAQGEKVVLLRLHHDDPFEVRVRAGLGLQNIQNYQSFSGLTYKVGSSFVFKNPTNRGDVFSMHVDFARSHRELVMKYALPWMFQLPFDGLVQAYSTKYAQPGFIGSKKNIYTVSQNGALVGLYKKTVHFDGGVNVGIEGMRTVVESGSKDIQLFALEVARAINFTPRLQNKMVPFLFVEPTMYLDYLDDKLNPTRGIYSLVSVKGMFPLLMRYERSFFVKLLTEHALFVPMGTSVLAMRMRFGHIFYQQFNAIMPAERFYLGGSHSLRGYNADAAPPLGVFIDGQGKKQAVPRGGKTMVNGNCELRIPLVAGLNGVLFQDVGLLSGDARVDFRINNIVAATGFGVRINTPVGPLRFDVGFNWRKHNPLEPRFAWFLTFGQAF